MNLKTPTNGNLSSNLKKTKRIQLQILKILYMKKRYTKEKLKRYNVIKKEKEKITNLTSLLFIQKNYIVFIFIFM